VFVETRSFDVRPFFAEPIQLTVRPQAADTLDWDARMAALAEGLRAARPAWYIDVAPTYGAVAVDLRLISPGDPLCRREAFLSLDCAIRDLGMVPRLLNMAQVWLPATILRQRLDYQADFAAWEARWLELRALLTPVMARFWIERDRELRSRAERRSFELLYNVLSPLEVYLFEHAMVGALLYDYQNGRLAGLPVLATLDQMSAAGFLSYAVVPDTVTTWQGSVPTKRPSENIEFKKVLPQVPFVRF
jgi:hypothetical protein